MKLSYNEQYVNDLEIWFDENVKLNEDENKVDITNQRIFLEDYNQITHIGYNKDNTFGLFTKKIPFIPINHFIENCNAINVIEALCNNK